MIGDDTRIGWIFSLSYDPNSAWGSVDEFYESFLDDESDIIEVMRVF